MDDLGRLRDEIDSLDRRMVDLLAERLLLAVEIGRAKEASGLAFYDPDRERKVLEKVTDLAGGRYPSGKLRSIYREIISATRTEQAEETILVHGARGSLAHYAAFLRFGASSRFEITARPEDVFARLEDESCGYATISLEGHSLEASLDRLDFFLHSDVSVFGEVSLRPRIAIYAEGGHVESGELFGTATVLAQVSRWMSGARGDRAVRMTSTLSEAIDQAQAVGGGVLGLPIMETLTGWQPTEDGLEDLPEGSRRFFILSRRENEATGRDKTLFLAVLANRTGSLYQFTEILARNEVNLCWLEPKTTHLGGWDHLFLAEIEGHQSDEAVATALAEIKGTAEVMRVLGSYPAESG